MRVYRKVMLSANSLRTGLFAVCFLAVMCVASGCGKTEALLSELRGEDEQGGAAETELSDGGDTAEMGAQGGDGTEAPCAGDSGNAEMTKPDQESPGGTSGAGGGEGSNTGQGGGAAAQNADAETGKIYVHVCGAVKSPGVYELPAGSRFYEAVEAAGGFAEGACEDYLNMAASLVDGSRLEIPTSEEIRAMKKTEKESGKADGESDTETEKYHYYTVGNETGQTAGSGGTGGSVPDHGAAAGTSSELVNINTADIAGLCKLPGVGEARAKAIIEYREKQGGFRKKEDIMQVSGIGEKMYARMEKCLTVE